MGIGSPRTARVYGSICPTTKKMFNCSTVVRLAKFDNPEAAVLARLGPEHGRLSVPLQNERDAMNRPVRVGLLSVLTLLLLRAPLAAQERAIELGSRRELFVDQHL